MKFNSKGKKAKSQRFYRGYILYNYGYYAPDKCIWWEAVNNETGEADFHAHRVRDLVKMIDQSLNK